MEFSPAMHPTSAPRVFALLWLLMGCHGSPEIERVVLIVVDTLRRDALAAYGGSAETPAIDALAARGQVHRHAVSSYHQTVMSMGALFTGRTPSIERRGAETIPMTGRTWCGMARFDPTLASPRCIPDAVPTLAEALREAGYRTIGIVSNPLLFVPFGIERGFDEWIEVGGPGTRVDRAVLWRGRRAAAVSAAAAEALERRTSDRFFLYVHFMDVHDFDYDLHDMDGSRQRYLAGLAPVDRAIGELLASLERQGLQPGTAVILTSDHGERFGEQHFAQGTLSHAGNPSFEELLAVPLIVAPPLFECVTASFRTDELFRVISERVGARGPVSDLAAGELFVSETEYRTYRHGRWKSFLRRADRKLALVDLAADPAERSDVADRHPEVARAHLERIGELADALGVDGAGVDARTLEDEARLRALGYLE